MPEHHVTRASRRVRIADMPMPAVRIATWNAEWAAPDSSRGQMMRDALRMLMADVLCVTEGSVDLLPTSGHVITSSPDYGYAAAPQRRKVLLWSREPWKNVDGVGSAGLPGGRFVAGTTASAHGPFRVYGVCIPWKDAHVRTGRRDRLPWQDHLAYLSALPVVLNDRGANWCVCLGDFNQRVPGYRAPAQVKTALTDAFAGWQVVTGGRIPPLGEMAIDHIACRPEGEIVQVFARSRFASDGTRLSDHFGVVADLQPPARPGHCG